MKRGLCTIYVVRHGESEANVAGRYGLDTGLTEVGKGQARRLAERLRGVRFDAVFSSTLVRARETAEVVAAGVGAQNIVPVRTKEALRERFYGEMEGRLGRELREELRELYELRDRSSYDEWKSVRMVAGYESDEELMGRFITGLREIAVGYGGKTVLVTNHASNMATFLVHLGVYRREELGRYALENTGYIRLEADGVDFWVREVVGLKVRKI